MGIFHIFGCLFLKTENVHLEKAVEFDEVLHAKFEMIRFDMHLRDFVIKNYLSLLMCEHTHECVSKPMQYHYHYYYHRRLIIIKIF